MRRGRVLPPPGREPGQPVRRSGGPWARRLSGPGRLLRDRADESDARLPRRGDRVRRAYRWASRDYDAGLFEDSGQVTGRDPRTASISSAIARAATMGSDALRMGRPMTSRSAPDRTAAP